MKQDNLELIEIFKDKNALLEGHFLLSSGLHSNRYFQSALLLQAPVLAAKLGSLIAESFPGKVDTVVSPAIGGLIIGHEVARAKGCRAIFSEKNDQGKPVFRRGFGLSKGEKVLVVEDVITTGLSSKEVLSLVVREEADLIGIGAVVNRSQSGLDNLKEFNKPIKTLLQLEVETWEASACPLCKEGTPAIKPGSRKI